MGVVAARVHDGLAEAVAAACRRAAEDADTGLVVLSGGVFQNRRLLERHGGPAGARRPARPRSPSACRPIDGGISYGQAAVAAALMASGEKAVGCDGPGHRVVVHHPAPLAGRIQPGGRRHMRHDIEFKTEDGVTARLALRARRAAGQGADHRHGPRLLRREGDVSRQLRRGLRGRGPGGGRVRQPQFRRQRRRAPPGDRPLAAGPRLPRCDHLRRRRWPRSTRTASGSGAPATAAATCWWWGRSTAA